MMAAGAACRFRRWDPPSSFLAVQDSSAPTLTIKDETECRISDANSDRTKLGLSLGEEGFSLFENGFSEIEEPPSPGSFRISRLFLFVVAMGGSTR